MPGEQNTTIKTEAKGWGIVRRINCHHSTFYRDEIDQLIKELKDEAYSLITVDYSKINLEYGSFFITSTIQCS